MIKKHLIYFGYFCFVFFVFSVNAQSMSADMQALCDRADRLKFSPLPESVKNPNPDPLLNAIENGADYNIIKSMITKINPDSVVTNGITPLMAAAYVGNWPAAQALIDGGADVNLITPELSTGPLLAALYTAKYPVACKLIQNNAKLPTAKENAGFFFFFTIPRAPDLNADIAVFVEYLLMNGFDPNDLTDQIESPLMGAVSASNIPLVKVLLKHGARLDTVTKEGQTVWTVAKRTKNSQVLKLLKEAQEKIDAAKKVKAPEPVHQ